MYIIHYFLYLLYPLLYSINKLTMEKGMSHSIYHCEPKHTLMFLITLSSAFNYHLPQHHHACGLHHACSYGLSCYCLSKWSLLSAFVIQFPPLLLLWFLFLIQSRQTFLLGQLNFTSYTFQTSAYSRFWSMNFLQYMLSHFL